MLKKIMVKCKLNSNNSYIENSSCFRGVVLLLFLVGTIIMVSGCESLTRLPEDQISSQQYWTSPKDMKLYLNQFYNHFRRKGAYWNPSMYYLDGRSDNMAPTSTVGPKNTRIAGRNTIHSRNGAWNNWYHQIRKVNVLLTKAKKNGLIKKSNGKRYMGEGRFFRAYFYFQLLRDYGSVPWIDKPLTPEDKKQLMKPRTPRAELVDHILDDVDYAIAHLPLKSQTGVNRLNKGVALIFKSRVALFEGTWETYHKGDPFEAKSPTPKNFLKAAAQSAKKLITMGNIYLAPSFSKLFNQNELADTPGILLARKYDPSLGTSSQMQRRATNGGGGSGLTQSLVNMYLCTDGKPIAVSPLYQGNSNLKDVVTNRDLRLKAMLQVPGDLMWTDADGTKHYFTGNTYLGGGVIASSTGYTPRIGDNPNYIKYAAGQQGPAFPVFRYGEALLNYAEAKAVLGNITQHDVDISINKLRDRVNMPHLELNNITPDPNWNFPNLSPIVNEVRRERRVETALQGYRLWDILRWSAAKQLVVGWIPLGTKFHPEKYPKVTVGKDVFLNKDGYIEPYKQKYPNGLQFNPGRDYLVAIPPAQIVLNPNLTQNPGWSK